MNSFTTGGLTAAKASERIIILIIIIISISFDGCCRPPARLRRRPRRPRQQPKQDTFLIRRKRPARTKVAPFPCPGENSKQIHWNLFAPSPGKETLNDQQEQHF